MINTTHADSSLKHLVGTLDDFVYYLRTRVLAKYLSVVIPTKYVKQNYHYLRQGYWN